MPITTQVAYCLAHLQIDKQADKQTKIRNNQTNTKQTNTELNRYLQQEVFIDLEYFRQALCIVCIVFVHVFCIFICILYLYICIIMLQPHLRKALFQSSLLQTPESPRCPLLQISLPSEFKLFPKQNIWPIKNVPPPQKKICCLVALSSRCSCPL